MCPISSKGKHCLDRYVYTNSDNCPDRNDRSCYCRFIGRKLYVHNTENPLYLHFLRLRLLLKNYAASILRALTIEIAMALNVSSHYYFKVYNRTTMKSVACSRQHADASRGIVLFLNKLVKSENNRMYCDIYILLVNGKLT